MQNTTKYGAAFCSLSSRSVWASDPTPLFILYFAAPLTFLTFLFSILSFWIPKAAKRALILLLIAHFLILGYSSGANRWVLVSMGINLVGIFVARIVLKKNTSPTS